MAKTKKKYVTRTVTLPDGTRKYVYGKTKAEAEAKLKEVKAQIEKGIRVNDDTTFAELAKLWVKNYKAAYVREGTLRNIESSITAHLIPHLGNMKVRDITPLMCQTLISDLAVSGHSVTGPVLSRLRDIMEVGVEMGCIARNPVPASLKAPKQSPKKGEKQVLPRQLETEILFQLTPMSHEYLFFILGKEIGARRGEILALSWDCIDLDSNTIRIRRNLTHDKSDRPVLIDVLKTDDGRRDLPITTVLHEVLSAMPVKEGLVFGELFTKRKAETVWLHIRSACAAVDAAYAENFTAHVLRHTYITRLFEAGLDIKEIQYLAGHKDVSTTLGTYAHYDKASRQEATFEKVRSVMA
jgi:integrase